MPRSLYFISNQKTIFESETSFYPVSLFIMRRVVFIDILKMNQTIMKFIFIFLTGYFADEFVLFSSHSYCSNMPANKREGKRVQT